MPELPEVEHVRRRIASALLHAHVVDCTIGDPRLVRPFAPRDVEKSFIGHDVTRVDRRGKWLRIAFDGATLLFAHLGMTGWYEIAPSDAPLRFERARITAQKKKGPPVHLVYVDPRRWGAWIRADEDTKTWRSLAADPLVDGIDASVLAAKLAKRKITVKEAIMDQRVLAGVGNIQAAEALWRAKIDPRSTASALDRKDVDRLTKAIHWTIERTLSDLEKDEHGPSPFKVYGRAGLPCLRCGATLKKIELGGRTTTFCPSCQVKITRVRSRRRPRAR